MMPRIIKIGLLFFLTLLVLALVAVLVPRKEEIWIPAPPPGGLSSIELPPHQEAALEEILERKRPGVDQFAVEKIHEKIKEQLLLLTPFIRKPPVDAADLTRRFPRIGKVLSREVQMAPLVPQNEKSIHKGAGIEAFSGEMSPAEPEWFRGALEAGREIARLIQPIPALQSATFEVMRIDGSLEGPFQTEILYQLSGEGKKGARHVWNGTWKVTWQSDRRISQIRPGIATRAVFTGSAFEDVAIRAVGRNSSYREQLLPGIDFFRDRLDRAAGIRVEGFHGIAVGDANGDGLDDFYLPEPPGLPNLLFENRGDGTFEDISGGSGTDLLDGTSQALFLDLDGDGDSDLFLVGPKDVLVLKNDGKGHFQPHPTGLDLDVGTGSLLCAAAADYDRDGAVDVYVGSTVFWRGAAHRIGWGIPVPCHDARNGAANFLLRNLGDGSFRDVTKEAGLSTGNNRFTLSAAWGDFDDDGFPDLCSANTSGYKNLYRNQGGGNFVEVTVSAGAQDPAFGASVAWEDIDGDGLSDLFFGNLCSRTGMRVSSRRDYKEDDPLRPVYQKLARGSTLLGNRGDGTFEDRTLSARVRGGGRAWCSDFIDVDLDGYEDLYLTSGFVTQGDSEDLESFFWRTVVSQSPELPVQRGRYQRGWEAIHRKIEEDGSWNSREPNRLLLSCQDGTFLDVSPASGMDFLEDGRAFAVLDSQGDGRPDIILRSRNGPRLRILENRLPPENHSIWFHLTGSGGNRQAIGARVDVETSRGRRSKTVEAGSGFLSQHSRWIYFGLGRESEVHRIRIRWPQGEVQELSGLAAGFRYWITEGEEPRREAFSKVSPPGRPPAPPPISGKTANESPLARTWLLESLTAPAIQLPDLSGRKRSLSEYEEFPLILLFLSAGCGASIRQASELAAGLQKLESSGGRVLSLAVAEAGHEKEIFERYGTAPFPVLPADREILAVWNVIHRSLFNRPRDLAVPSAFLLGRGGRIEKIYRGFTTVEEMTSDIRRLPLQATARLQQALPFPGKLLNQKFHRDLLLLGASLSEAGAPAPAIQILSELSERRPDSAEVSYFLGSALARMGKAESAEEAYHKALAIRPGLACALDGLGMIYFNAKKFQTARDYFLQSFRKGWSESVLGLANSCLPENQTRTAVEILRDALRSDPESPDCWRLLGYSHYRSGEIPEGIKAYQMALDLSPTDPEAAYGLANLLLERGTSSDLERARRVLIEGLDHHPGNIGLLNTLGSLCSFFLDFAGAEEAYEAAIEADPKNEAAYLNLARLHLKARQFEHAAKVLQDLLSIHPGHTAAKGMLSEIKKKFPSP